MATKYLKLDGTISWANGQFGGLFSPDPKYPYYKAQVYLTQDSWDKFKKSGLRLESKTDENGDYVTFRRPIEGMIKGKIEHFGPPRVFFAPGIEPTKDIGNGSTVQIDVQVYDSKKGKGHRLESVSVMELVQYDKTGGGRREGFMELTEAIPSGSDTGGSTDADALEDAEEVTGDFDDEIPFDGGTKVVEEEKPMSKGTPQEGNKTVTKKPTPFRR